MASPLRLKEGLPWIFQACFPNVPSKSIKSNLAIRRCLDDPSKVFPGLNDHSSAEVDYLQSASIRIDELPIYMVQPRPIQTNQTLIAPQIVHSPSNPNCGCDHHHFIRR
jgi:hypothetical protein